jgi:DNA primase
MARYGQDKIEEVRSRADIVEIVGAHVRLRRSGRNFTGLCPFHDEKTPSFSVSAERGFFHCFGCGAGGTVFDFVMRIEGLTFPEALQTLARRCGVTLPPPENEPGGAPAGERDTLVTANQTAAEFYAHVLWNTPDGAAPREYLQSRGITVETARAFMLGFAPARPANLAAALHKRGLAEAGLKLGLLRSDDRSAPYDMFRGRLMFPIRDVQGRVIAFGGRVLDSRLPKYINSPESPLYSKARTVYGIVEARPAIAKADRTIIVEGYIDVIALWQAGFKETVASLGTALTVEQLRLLGRYTKNLIACFDGDAAGRKASMRALEVFLEAGLLGRGAFIPPGFDPDTLVRQRGAQAFGEIIEAGELLVDYFLREQAEAARGSLDERARVAERVAQILGKVANPFEFDLLARKAATLIGVGEELLRSEARKGGTERRGVSSRPPVVSAPVKPVAIAPQGAAAQAELGLLVIAMRWPEFRRQIAAQLDPDDGGDGLRPLIKEVCASDEAPASLEIVVMNRLAEHERGQLSALMVGPLLSDAAQSIALVEDYLIALDTHQRRGQEAELRRTAVTGTVEEGAAAAQAVITLRREARRH